MMFSDPMWAAPDYLEAPFTAAFGTQEWIDDAMSRVHRAQEEYMRAVTELAAEPDVMRALALKQHLLIQADNLVRAKWMQREIVKAMERLVKPIVIAHEPFCACGRKMLDCDGSRAGCVSRHTKEGAF